jgi:hypothetical protein
VIALWMLYTTVIGGLLAAAAQALERVAAGRGWPRRWVWLTAIFALPVVPLLTTELQPAASALATGSSVEAGISSTQWAGTPSTPGAIAQSAWVSTLSWLPSALVRAGRSIGKAWDAFDVTAPPTAAVREAQSRVPGLARADDGLTYAWVIATLLLLSGYIAAAVKLSRQRRRWPKARVDGEPVLLSADAGPAVVGTLRPTIVLPAWSLSIDAPLRALILTHEREHLRARDPLLLHLVTLTAYFLPWNLPVWWMLRRLRIAIEVDCDRRVLRTGCDPHRYADLLLTVGSRSSAGGRVLVPALVERQSLLAHRILAMCPDRSKFRQVRLACSVGVASLLLAAAYSTPMPAVPPSAGMTITDMLAGEPLEVTPLEVAPSAEAVWNLQPRFDTALGRDSSSRDSSSDDSSRALTIESNNGMAVDPQRKLAPRHAQDPKPPAARGAVLQFNRPSTVVSISSEERMSRAVLPMTVDSISGTEQIRLRIDSARPSIAAAPIHDDPPSTAPQAGHQLLVSSAVQLRLVSLRGIVCDTTSETCVSVRVAGKITGARADSLGRLAGRGIANSSMVHMLREIVTTVIRIHKGTVTARRQSGPDRELKAELKAEPKAIIQVGELRTQTDSGSVTAASPEYRERQR